MNYLSNIKITFIWIYEIITLEKNKNRLNNVLCMYVIVNNVIKIYILKVYFYK